MVYFCCYPISILWGTALSRLTCEKKGYLRVKPILDTYNLLRGDACPIEVSSAAELIYSRSLLPNRALDPLIASQVTRESFNSTEIRNTVCDVPIRGRGLHPIGFWAARLEFDVAELHEEVDIGV